MSYGFHASVRGSFADVVQRVVEALKREGFGVLSDIDIQKAMKDKLGRDVPAQRILGACNPPLAWQALQSEADIGLLLPCNVTVRQADGDEVVVGFLDPALMVQVTSNPALEPVANDAAARLRRVRDALEGDGGAAR